MDKFNRNKLLLGEEFNKTLTDKVVLIAGLGGVGGYACEAIARLGVKKMILVDFDNVDETNINRQIIATTKTVGQAKVDLFEKRLKEINPEIEVLKYKKFIDQGHLSFFENRIDYIIDAIDTIEAKVVLMKESLERQIPIVSSMGMAKRIDATQVRITTLAKTHNDKMAQKLRYLGRKAGVNLDKITAVYSLEIPGSNIVKPLPSIVTVPGAAGLACVTAFIKEFQK